MLFLLPSRVQFFVIGCVIAGPFNIGFVIERKVISSIVDMTLHAENLGGNWTHTLSLWCLNPAVVFKDVAELSLSVILTSG